MSGFYERVVAPRLVNGLYSAKLITEQTQRVVPLAEGVVVEIGIGSGQNLPLYDAAKVEKVIGIDVNAPVLPLSADRLAAVAFPVEVLRNTMSVRSCIADTVLITYSLCSIPDPGRALAEVRRILKPSGRLLFCEHGRSIRPGVARWQDRLNPLWSRIAGGCNINRDVQQMIEAAGFRIDMIARYRAMRPEVLGFHYVGSARVG